MPLKRSKRLSAKARREMEIEEQAAQEDNTNNKLDQVLLGLASMNSRLTALESTSDTNAGASDAFQGSPYSGHPTHTPRTEGDPEVTFHPRHGRTPSGPASSAGSNQQTAEAVARRLKEFNEFNPLDDPALNAQGMSPNTGGGRHSQGAIQSGANVTSQSRVIRDLHQEWPHTNLLGRNCSVKYVNITLHQFNLGFINLISTFLERDPEKARHMLAVFKSYQEDLAAGYEFPLVRSTHLAFLTSMEQGKLEWSDLGELRMLRQSIIWNPPPPPRNAPRTANPTAAKIRTPADPKSPPCIAYNTSAGCSKQSPHNSYHHICEHCFTVRGLSFGHSKAACYSLHGAPPKTG